MARRRTRTRKTQRRRQPKPMINVLNAVEAYVVGSAVTTGLFGTNLAKFATEGWLTERTPATQMGAGNSWTLSASELIQSAFGDDSHMSSQWQGMGGVPAAIKQNFINNGGKAVLTVLLAPALFKVGKTVARRPIAQMNKGIRSLGLGSTVKI